MDDVLEQEWFCYKHLCQRCFTVYVSSLPASDIDSACVPCHQKERTLVNSRQKGSRAERTVLKILKEAFGGSPWERKSLGIPGPDLLTPDWFCFAVEIKDDKAIRMVHIFKPTKLLLQYWQQCSSQADALDLMPLLVAHIEGIWMACTSWGNWITLDDFCVLQRDRLTLERTTR